MASRYVRLCLAFLAGAALHAADPVPGIIHHQGRIAVSGVDFTGNGAFSFALLNGANGPVLWHHDGTSTAVSQPGSQLTIAVTAGLYSVALGDTALGMASIPSAVFDHDDVHLRIWFDDAAPISMQQLSPDIRITSVGYAQRAATIADGAVTSASVLNGSLTGADFSATAAISDAQVDNNLTIAGGTVNNTVIGGTTPAAASVTTLSASGTATLAGATATSLSVSGATTLAGTSVTTLSASGASTLAGVSATTLSATGATTLGGAAALTGGMQLGSGTDHVAVSTTGAMSYAGTARPRRSAILTAASAITPASGATVNLAGTNFAHYTVDFADAQNHSAAWQFVVPDSFDSGSVDVTLYWTATVATSAVDWTVAVDGRPTDGATAFDVALSNSSPISPAAPGTIGAMTATTVTLTSGWADGEIAVVQVSRAGGADANNGTARLVMVKVEWLANAESD